MAVLLIVVFVFPIYWLFIISFKTPDEIFAFPPVWYPKVLQLANYKVLFKDGDAATVGNSLILASVSTVFAMILGTIAAYSLVALQDRWRKPGGVDHLAAHDAAGRHRRSRCSSLYVWLGWVDTYIGLIVLYTAFSFPTSSG